MGLSEELRLNSDVPGCVLESRVCSEFVDVVRKGEIINKALQYGTVLYEILNFSNTRRPFLY